ncbi:MAG: glycosyltransferase family 1 protein [Bacteroidota bacterium]
MNIGIDARVLERKMTGIGRYLQDLLRHIPDVDGENTYYLFGYGEVKVGMDRACAISTAPRFISSKLYSPFWLFKVLPNELRKYDIDVLFSPNFLAPPKKRSDGWKSIPVICDTFLKIGKKYFSAAYSIYVDSILKRSITKSDAIVTISQHSKKDIIRYYGVPEQKIHVIYPSADERFNPRQMDPSHRNEVAERFKLPAEFILCVGVVEVRKNIIGLTRVADILRKRGVHIPVVLIGRPGFGFKKIMREVTARENFLYLSHVEERDLPDIYRMASVFVFPSYYEGFGIPPLEAMQSGTPVVASNTSSLPEVLGEAGRMFHPDDAAGFAEEIVRLLEDRAYHQARSESGIAQARRFSPHDSASALVQLFSLVNP